MADGDYTGLKLYAYHEPDSPPDPNHQRPDSVEQGAGFLVIGVEVKGVRVPLARMKAGKFLQNVERAKSGAASSGADG